jgi:hypothetical protein
MLDRAPDDPGFGCQDRFGYNFWGVAKPLF